jgi:hypothetical protein
MVQHASERALNDDTAADTARRILIFVLKFIGFCLVGFAVIVFALFALCVGVLTLNH